MNSVNKSFAMYFRILILLGTFSIAMGALEAIVVVYLREIYYPQGFEFPLILLSPKIFFVECLRELSTIVMLIMVGVIAGKNSLQRFSYFLFAFAVWDIFYYVWLKVLLNSSAMGWACTRTDNSFLNNDTLFWSYHLFTSEGYQGENKMD